MTLLWNICLLLFFTTVCQGQQCPAITKGMVNMAGTVGKNTSFVVEACSQETIFAWFHRLKPVETKIWQESHKDNIIDPRFRVEYPTSTSSPGEYKLLIPKVSFDLAGQYDAKLLLDLDNGISSAWLVAVESMAKFVCPPSAEQIQDGQDIIPVCEVKYRGHMSPMLTWVDSTGAELANYTYHTIGDDESTVNSVRATANITATPEINGTLFYCKLSFDNRDGKGPEYTDMCSTFYIVQSMMNTTQSPTAAAVSGVAALNGLLGVIITTVLSAVTMVTGSSYINY